MNKKIVYLFVVLLTLAVSVPTVRATKTSVTATADSYVDSVAPNANYGGTGTLDVYNYHWELLDTTYQRNTWLKFDLSVIPAEATVNSIVLRVHTGILGVLATNKVGVFLCNDNSWTETGITWTNAPSISESTPLTTVDVATNDKDYDFTLTSALKGKSIVSLVLKSMQSTSLSGWIFFDSKEAVFEENSPRLMLDYSLDYSTPSQPVDMTPYLIGVIVVIVVVIVLGIAMMQLRRRKKTLKQT